MSSLLHLQEQFQKFLLSGDSEIQNAIMHTELVSVDTRLSIYRDAYTLRLIESLIANFPSLYAYLGTEAFNELARDYIRAHPSAYRSIRWFGDVLPEFIRHYYPKNPHLAELAAFEWMMTLAFDAADAAVVKIEDMVAIPPDSWGDLQFVLHPSVQFMNHSWNAIPIWQALAHDEDLPDLQQHSESTPWVLWRTPEYLIQFYSLSPAEAWALDALSQKSSFAELCEGLCQWLAPEEVGLRAASYLKNWIQNGMLSRLFIIS